MTDPALVERLEEAFHLTKSPFVRYIFECSEPEVHDDIDRRALTLFEDWSRESRYSQTAVGDLLVEEGVVPRDITSFSIEFSQFNFLSAAYLLGHVIERAGAEIGQLVEIRNALEAWPRAKDLLGAVISRQRYYLDRAKKLAAERPVEPPKPPRIKGTSASRW